MAPRTQQAEPLLHHQERTAVTTTTSSGMLKKTTRPASAMIPAATTTDLKTTVGAAADSLCTTTGNARAASNGTAGASAGAPETAERVAKPLTASRAPSARSLKTGGASAAKKIVPEEDRARGSGFTTASAPAKVVGHAKIGNSSAAVIGNPKPKERPPAPGAIAAGTSNARVTTRTGAADRSVAGASTAAAAASVGGVSTATTNVVYIVPEQTPPAVRLMLGRRSAWTEWDPEVHGADEVGSLKYWTSLYPVWMDAYSYDVSTERC